MPKRKKMQLDKVAKRVKRAVERMPPSEWAENWTAPWLDDLLAFRVYGAVDAATSLLQGDGVRYMEFLSRDHGEWLVRLPGSDTWDMNEDEQELAVEMNEAGEGALMDYLEGMPFPNPEKLDGAYEVYSFALKMRVYDDERFKLWVVNPDGTPMDSATRRKVGNELLEFSAQ